MNPRSRHLRTMLDGLTKRQRARVRRLLGLLQADRDEIVREIERLQHVASVWELTIHALEKGRVGGLAGVRIRTGAKLTGVRLPRRLKERGKRG